MHFEDTIVNVTITLIYDSECTTHLAYKILWAFTFSGAAHTDFNFSFCFPILSRCVIARMVMNAKQFFSVGKKF
jgi:hypothetical protein